MTDFTLAQLCGLTDTHINPDYALHTKAVEAFVALQEKARQANIELHIASGFRDFFRQRLIWNNKFSGIRPVLNNASQPVDITKLSEIEIIHAIMRWSALPGASRHHWGCDCDIYAVNLLTEGVQLQLEPWEYEPGGHQYPVAQWLEENMATYGFYLPYRNDRGGVAREPWHISYRPLAKQAEQKLTLPQLRYALFNIPALIANKTHNAKTDIKGIELILENLDSLYTRYIINTDKD